MAEEKSINIQTEGGDIGNVSGLVAGDVSGVVNLGEVGSNVTNTLNTILSSRDTKQVVSIEPLLSQMKVAIESESTLAPEDKLEALEQFEVLRTANQHPEDVSNKKNVRTAVKILKGTVAGLPNSAGLVNTSSKLLPEIETNLSKKLNDEAIQLDSHTVPSQSNHSNNNTAAPTVILFLAADPTDASRLRLGTELREIQDSLQMARLRDKFRLEQRMSIRAMDISQALLDEAPRIVHFSGHGTGESGVCFENEVGKVQLVQSEALAALFDLVSEQVDCVLLNACYSEVQAKAIANHIEYVIGLTQAIGDKATIAFSIGFYQALGAGKSVKDAYRFGCVQIRLQGIPKHLTPVLVTK